jgi:hypothetical protein
MTKNNKKYFIKKITPIPLYNGHLLIIFSNNINKITKYVDDLDEDENFAHTFEIFYEGFNCPLIVLNFKHLQKITHGDIHHEILHATNIIAKNRGFVADFDNDEPVAYICTWVANEVYDLIKENNILI